MNNDNLNQTTLAPSTLPLSPAVRPARRIGHLRRSIVRDMMGKIGNPGIISFSGGLPDPALFPSDEIAQAAEFVLRTDGRTALQYTSTEGYLPLREYVSREVLAPRGVSVDPSCILIVNGSQQALDLVGRAFVDEGDKVILEEPAYMAAIQAFELYGPAFLTAPILESGIDTGVVGQLLRRHNVRLLYAVPDFQNPTGRSYTEETRRTLAALLHKRDTILLEDMPYSELWYDAPPPRPIAALRPENTLLTGSFSKVLAPGFRLGWIAGPKDLIEPIALAKQAADLCSNHVAQRVVHHYLTAYPQEERMEKLRASYRRKRDRFLTLLREHFPPQAAFTRPGGGMFFWVELPEGISCMELLDEAVRRGVIYAPGRSFLASCDRDNAMRLNFTHASEEQAAQGLSILGELLHEQMEHHSCPPMRTQPDEESQRLLRRK